MPSSYASLCLIKTLWSVHSIGLTLGMTALPGHLWSSRTNYKSRTGPDSRIPVSKPSPSPTALCYFVEFLSLEWVLLTVFSEWFILLDEDDNFFSCENKFRSGKKRNSSMTQLVLWPFDCRWGNQGPEYWVERLSQSLLQDYEPPKPVLSNTTPRVENKRESRYCSSMLCFARCC